MFCEKKRESMGIADAVEELMPQTCYAARECLGSKRNRLHIGSRVYCMLSGPDDRVMCPLQYFGDRALAECRRDEYLRELNERKNNI